VSRSNRDDQFKYVTSIKVLTNQNEYLLHYLAMSFTADQSKFSYCRLETLLNHIRIDNR